MSTNEFIAHKKGPSAHLKEIGWEKYYGTTSSGNLPRYKSDKNPCNIDISKITMPGVELKDFKQYHVKCPYSTQSNYHYVVDTDRFSPTYKQLKELDASELVDHTVTSGVMIRYSRGSKYGWLCVDDNCPYYNGIVSEMTISGTRYFYI